jgi:O-succinylbenzoate synthase
VVTNSLPAVRALAAPVPLTLDAIELRLVRLPLVHPFETSFGRIDSRVIMLVGLEAGGVRGWGEIVAFEEPLFNSETGDTARLVIRQHFAPALLTGTVASLDALAARLARFRGHEMARAGIELAWMDLVSRLHKLPLTRALGGTRDRVGVGVSLGIEATLPALLARVDDHLAQGYQRIKLKVKPGWDVDVVDAVRQRHPDILLSVDANTAYTLADLEHLRRLDAYNLLMIEQPLEHDDLHDHAVLQAELKTAICLDETITHVRKARQALDIKACRIINIKVGRVGGYSQALAIHDLCLSRGIPVWCGGMLESGIGRAHNLALASLPGFTLPGDISASARYFSRDLVDPPVTVGPDGTVAVPQADGLGIPIDTDFLTRQTSDVERFTRTA